jgi:hypothetical protein
MDELQAAVIEFNNWAMFNDRLGTSGRHATRTFAHETSPEAQEALITAAQAFEEEPPAAPPDPVTPIDPPQPDVEEEISWMR